MTFLQRCGTLSRNQTQTGFENQQTYDQGFSICCRGGPSEPFCW